MPLDASSHRGARRFRIPPHSVWFTLLLGAMSALPPLSIDMGLPALPALAAGLGASAAAAGLSLSLFVAGFAVAQLLLGPMSDRFGRRPVLLGGCMLFAAAGIGCATSSSIDAVNAWRFVQGAGGGAGTVLAMAIVRDLFEGAAARARLSTVMMVLSVAPIVAPTLGGLLLPLGGWRMIYAALAIAGIALSLAILVGLEESNPTPDRGALRPDRLWRNYLRALRSSACLGNALTGGLSMGCMFAYVAGSPLVLLGVYRLSTSFYGVLFACTAGSIMAGAWLSGRLAGRGVAAAAPVVWGLGIAAATALALLAACLAATPPLGLLVPLLVGNTFCLGLISPNVTHAAIEGLPEIAGVATAVVGCLRMLGAAASSALVSALFPALGLVALPLAMAMFACAALLVWWCVARP